MDYENDSLIIIIRKEFLIHQSGTWYSYQRPLKPIACLPFYDSNTSCWNTLQLNEDGQLVFCQLAVTQMICSDIQMPIRNASNVIIKGQLISKCPFGVFKSPKNQRKEFCPKPLKRGHMEKVVSYLQITCNGGVSYK